MENEVKVSIVMMVYNHEKYLRQALDSILSQHVNFKIEVLIGEDCSPDQSKEILQEYQKQFPDFFQVFYRKQNMGGTKNLYDVLMHTKGKYIAYLEGDDFWIDPYKLQKQADFLDSHSQFQGVASDFIKVNSNNEVIKKNNIAEKYKDSVFTWHDFLEEGFVYQTASFMHRNIYLDGGDYAILYRSHELVGDLTVNTLILNRGDVFILSDVMSAYREIIAPNGTNACSIGRRDKALSAIKTLRQHEMLNSLITEHENFDKRIALMKLDYTVKMCKRERGYSLGRFLDVIKIGGRRPNLLYLKFLIKKLVTGAI